MEVGSIWGHGSYVAPDWTADWLHREAMFILERWAAKRVRQAPTTSSPPNDKANLRGRLEELYRANTYDPATNTIRIDPVRGRAFEGCLQHYSDVFSKGNTAYAIPAGSRQQPRAPAAVLRVLLLDLVGRLHQPPRRDHLLHEQLAVRAAGRQSPHRRSVVWTGVSIIMLLAGISAMVWWYAAQKADDDHGQLPDIRSAGQVGPPRRRRRATLKYFWVVSALILVQMLAGRHHGALRRRRRRLLRHPALRNGCPTA